MLPLNTDQVETQPIIDHTSKGLHGNDNTVGSRVERMMVKDGDKSMS